ncbi:hypothetical protein ACGFR8_07640 [Streptomyces brevispora]|uniref:hypothetical protein n=1 Tax=Streptomyces brevispora TaxID=887462 RepID=UPI00371EE284
MIRPGPLVPLVEAVQRHVCAGDLDHAAAVLDEVQKRGDASDVYGLCCVVAESGLQALRDLVNQRPDLDDSWARTLGLVDVDGSDLHRLFAARFLVAYLNEDRQMTTALFSVAGLAGPQSRTESVCALLALVSGFHRHTRPHVPGRELA